MWFHQNISTDWFNKVWIDTMEDCDTLNKKQEKEPYRVVTPEEIQEETQDFFNTYF